MAAKNSYFCVVSLFILSGLADSAKILGVFPFPSISHQVVFRPLTHELARRGHEVTVITTDPAFPKEQAPRNLTEIDIHDLSYPIWYTIVAKAMQRNNNEIFVSMESFSDLVNELCAAQLTSPQVQEFLKGKHEFDLVLVESLMDPALVFSYLYKAPVIQISSLGGFLNNNDNIGMPTHPLLYPSPLSTRIHYNTMWEKLADLYTYFSDLRFYSGYYIESQDAMLRKVFGPEVPSAKDLLESVHMLFANIHPMWVGNVPVPPSVINIWGIHKRAEKKLPDDLQSYLDSSKNGVIYMSFGTNSIPSAMPAERIQAFVKVFSELPYDIIWKWDKDELPGRTENIKIGKWFPQSDLLKHPKIKLFITQGGIQSTEEAINAGVPLVGVPIFGDQFYNVARYVYFKIGTSLELPIITAEKVEIAVKTVLEDDGYSQNIVKLRNIMRDEPQPALERAVWWTEYVLRHKGAKHLTAAGAHLSWIEYFEVPLVSMLFLSLVTFIIIAYLIIKSIPKFFKRKSVSTCKKIQ